MSSGRKKSEVPEIKAPPTITRTEFANPLGDRFISETKKNTQSVFSELSPVTQGMVNRSLSGMIRLFDEIDAPDAVRQQAINQRADDFYNLQAAGLNRDHDDRMKQTRSDLSKRFGGTYNATFGTDLMSRMERDHGSLLGDVRLQANLLGEDLRRDDQADRLQRFALFQNFLGDLNNQAQGLGSQGVQVLQNERTRATDLAITRANMIQRAQAMDAEARARRSSLIGTLVGTGVSLASAGTGSIAGSLLGLGKTVK